MTRTIPFTLAIITSSAAAWAQQSANGVSPHCSKQKTITADCKPAKRSPVQKTEFALPPQRKPPKPPKQNSQTPDDLPERREDNF